MTNTQQPKQVIKLNEASAKIAVLQERLQQDKHSVDHTDEKCRKLQSKMDAVLQACANQHMVSKEVYTEKPIRTEPKPYNYKIKRRIGKVFKCTHCKSFQPEKHLTNTTSLITPISQD